MAKKNALPWSVAALLVSVIPAFAPPPPPQPAPNDISLVLALQGAQAALTACDKTGEEIAVAVFDRDERIKVMLLSDGADSRNWQQAVQRQAHTVLTQKMSSGDYGNSFNKDYHAMAQAQSVDRNLAFTPGAVPLLKGGVIVGAISAAGNNPHGVYKPIVGQTGYEYMGSVESCANAGRDKIEAGWR